MVVSAAVKAAPVPTALQAKVLRACHTWRRPADLTDLAAEPYHLLARLVRLGWLEVQARKPERQRPDRGQRRRWQVYRTSKAGAAILEAL